VCVCECERVRTLSFVVSPDCIVSMKLIHVAYEKVAVAGPVQYASGVTATSPSMQYVAASPYDAGAYAYAGGYPGRVLYVCEGCVRGCRASERERERERERALQCL
jgi:hypothetical protein